MKTIPEIFEFAASRGVAIDTGVSSLQVAQLNEQGRKLASSLDSLGIGYGDRVAAWMPNIPEYLTLYAATARLGAILVAVNNRFRELEVADIVGRSGAKLLVVSPDAGTVDIQGLLAKIARRDLPDLQHLVLCGSTSLHFNSPWPEVVCHAFDDLTNASPMSTTAATPETLSNIFTTSGTTAAPKFAAHTQGRIAGHVRDAAVALGMMESESRSLQLLPFCGVFGFVQAMAALVSATPLVMPVIFDAHEAAHLCIERSVTHLFATDDMVHRMIEHGCELSQSKRPFPTLKACAFAQFNTYLSDLPERAEAHGIPMLAPYGMSEVFAIFALRRHGQPAVDRHRPGGTLVSPNAHVRARSPDTGEVLSHGEAGELEVTGPFIFSEYYGNEDATAAALTEDGYLRTGDIGYTESDTTFTYLQRAGDTLRLGGFLVSPQEIEDAVMQAPGVADAQVVAVGTSAGARPVAFIIPSDDVVHDERATIATVEQQLPKFKTPIRVLTLSAFPVTDGPNGTKIQRGKLRELAREALGL